MYNSFIQQNRSAMLNLSPQWDGATSQRFKKGKRVFPGKDLIRNGMTMPLQTIQSGRQHYVNELSPEQQFRRPKRQVSWHQHWHPRASQIRTFDFKPTSPSPRPEKKHLNPNHNPETRFESVKTSFLQKHRQTNEYFVEDRMQRKVRVDPLQMKKTFYRNLNIFKRPLDN